MRKRRFLIWEKKTAPFRPKICSDKILSKFYDATVLPRYPDDDDAITMTLRVDPIRGLTQEIKELSESGLTPEQIAEKIDPDKFFESDPEMYPWKVWKVGPWKDQVDRKF